MLARLCFLLALAVPGFAHAGLLQYDLDFETYDSENFVNGSGFLLTDTDLNAIVGGYLECDEFIFTWSNDQPEPLARLDEYYDADVVRGNANGIDEMTGEAGTFELMFLLWPPSEDGNFADELHNHVREDVWSTIHLPSSTRPEDHWMNSPLETHFVLDSPVDVVFDVPAPGSLPLVVLGMMVLALRRFRARI
ncbi:MAG: hypothetical protein ACOCVV_01885 [Marinobacter sp.]